MRDAPHPPLRTDVSVQHLIVPIAIAVAEIAGVASPTSRTGVFGFCSRRGSI
jgi:hypothetical protein